PPTTPAGALEPERIQLGAPPVNHVGWCGGSKARRQRRGLPGAVGGGLGRVEAHRPPLRTRSPRCLSEHPKNRNRQDSHHASTACGTTSEASTPRYASAARDVVDDVTLRRLGWERRKPTPRTRTAGRLDALQA